MIIWIEKQMLVICMGRSRCYDVRMGGRDRIVFLNKDPEFSKTFCVLKIMFYTKPHFYLHCSQTQ